MLPQPVTEAHNLSAFNTQANHKTKENTVLRKSLLCVLVKTSQLSSNHCCLINYRYGTLESCTPNNSEDTLRKQCL